MKRPIRVTWGPLAAYAADQLHVRLMAPHRPGFGESTFQPGRTIGAWGADMLRLADEFALQRFAVIGLSGGGPYDIATTACPKTRGD
jgi:pimeloyl-ACP methyl ester carboxylesterase